MQAFLDPQIWTFLNNARQNINAVGVTFAGTPTAAIYLYHGRLLWARIAGILPQLVSDVRNGNLEIFILSAGYGVIHCFESGQEYNGELQGRIASYWIDQYSLDNIISNIILKNKPDQVYGYLTGPDQKLRSYQYRYTFCEGVRIARAKGFGGLAGCFGVISGIGSSGVSPYLADILIRHHGQGFNYQWAINSANWPSPGDGLRGGSGQIGFQIL
jgi:hypothetical protein